MEAGKTLSVHVHGGMCDLEFTPVVSTGTDSDTRPGIGFEFKPFTDVIHMPDIWLNSMGVISREDAAKLHKMLGEFLANYPSQWDGAEEKGQ